MLALISACADRKSLWTFRCMLSRKDCGNAGRTVMEKENTIMDAEPVPQAAAPVVEEQSKLGYISDSEMFLCASCAGAFSLMSSTQFAGRAQFTGFTYHTFFKWRDEGQCNSKLY